MQEPPKHWPWPPAASVQAALSGWPVQLATMQMSPCHVAPGAQAPAPPVVEPPVVVPPDVAPPVVVPPDVAPPVVVPPVVVPPELPPLEVPACVSQLVASLHGRLLGQGAGVPVTQVPEALQVLVASMPATQESAHTLLPTVTGTNTQVPALSQPLK
jgi:hypothetical protein